MKQTNVLTEAKRLYRIGFPIIWIKPHSKVPLQPGWTTGARAPWQELEKTFHPTMNVGVRLGTPALIKHSNGQAGYLAVIDVDVKSKEPHHREEALKATNALLKGATLPLVLSGRGGGSCHYYCLTAEPFKPFNTAQSNDRVKAYMPSKTPSKKELAELTPEEIKKGIRIARAWEVSLYSDGRQVVLPPSIHPDSNQPYSWFPAFEIENADSIPFFEFEGNQETASIKKTKKETNRTFTSEEKNAFELDDTLDIHWLPNISKELRDLIINGVWKNAEVTDRSAYLLVAANGLLSAGYKRDEILSVLTDQNTFLGECGYEHAKTTSRARAAQWVYKYSVKKVLDERNPALVFKDYQVGANDLSPEEEAEQTELLRDKPEERGFYSAGAKGRLKPEYRALLKEFEARHPYKTIADMKTVYTFNGTHYTDITPIEIKAFAEEKMKPEPDEKIRNEFLCKVLANQTARRTFFTESTEGHINFKNGVLDLSQSEDLLPHSPDYGFRGVLPYDFNPDAQCPLFTKWIKSIMLGDNDLVAILQEFMGYIVRGGSYKYHKALWLGGVGRNGKSTFIDLLKVLIGTGNYSVISIKSLMTDKFSGADLDGKIANFSEETSPQELADSGPFKNLTGDGQIQAQKKYGDPYSLRNRAKLVMTYNIIPDLKDLSAGMLSRPLIIPFDKVIKDEEQDREIGAKLASELSGIFNFALEGWNRLEAQGGFTTSEKSKIALQKIREESCNVYQWVENHLTPLEQELDEEGNYQYEPHQLYAMYRQHEKYAFREIDFYRRLNVHPMVKEHRKRTKKGIIYFGFLVR